MEIKIKVTRSNEFCRKQAALTGDNCQNEITVKVDPKDFSPQGREDLLTIGRGAYVDIEKDICFDQQYDPHTGKYSYSYGSKMIAVDSISPTVADIEIAIRGCLTALAADKEKRNKDEADRNAEAAAKKAAEVAHAEKIAEAKVLLARELSLMEKFKKDRDRLGEFLSRISDDVLRETAREVADESSDIDKVIAGIEDSTSFRVFGDK